jgi:putative transposase
MKKSRYTEEQIIGILKQHEAGVKTADLCREHGISAATFYGWKSKFGGMEVSEAQRPEAMIQFSGSNCRLTAWSLIRGTPSLSLLTVLRPGADGC